MISFNYDIDLSLDTPSASLQTSRNTIRSEENFMNFSDDLRLKCHHFRSVNNIQNIEFSKADKKELIIKPTRYFCVYNLCNNRRKKKIAYREGNLINGLDFIHRVIGYMGNIVRSCCWDIMNLRIYQGGRSDAIVCEIKLCWV